MKGSDKPVMRNRLRFRHTFISHTKKQDGIVTEIIIFLVYFASSPLGI